MTKDEAVAYGETDEGLTSIEETCDALDVLKACVRELETKLADSEAARDKALNNTACAYCGEVMTHVPGTAWDARKEGMIEHILACPAHPLQRAFDDITRLTAEMNRALAEADMHRHDADSLAVKLAEVEAALTAAEKWTGMHAQILADGETAEPSQMEAVVKALVEQQARTCDTCGHNVSDTDYGRDYYWCNHFGLDCATIKTCGAWEPNL